MIIQRVTLQGYLVLLVGLLFIVQNTRSAISTGVSIADGSGIVPGLFGIGSGVFGYLRPNQLPRGTEAAPPYLYALASIATVAFVIVIVI